MNLVATKSKVLGHVVLAEGTSADCQKVVAIRNLPAPKNTVEVRSFLCMVNHVSKFAKHIASKTKPSRELLKKKNTWHWGQPQEQSFKGNQRNYDVSTHTCPRRPKQRH